MEPSHRNVSAVITPSAAPKRLNSLPFHEFSSWFDVKVRRMADEGYFARSA